MTLAVRSASIAALLAIMLLLSACQIGQDPRTGSGDASADTLERLEVIVPNYDGPSQEAFLIGFAYPYSGFYVVSEGRISTDGRLIIDLDMPSSDALQAYEPHGRAVSAGPIHLGDTEGSGGTIRSSDRPYRGNLEAGGRAGMLIYATQAMTLADPDHVQRITTHRHQDPITLSAGWNFRIATILETTSGPPVTESEPADPEDITWRYYGVGSAAL